MTTASGDARPATCTVVDIESRRPAAPLRFDRATVTDLCDREGAGVHSLLGNLLRALDARARTAREAWDAEDRDPSTAPRPTPPAPRMPGCAGSPTARRAVEELRLIARTIGLPDLSAACEAVMTCEWQDDPAARAACRSRLLRLADTRRGPAWTAADPVAPA